MQSPLCGMACWGCLCLASFHPLSATERAVIHVDATRGNDADSGTLEKPLKSIERAQQVARLVASEAKSVLVSLRGGVHRLERPLGFNTQDSASAGQSVTYAGYSGESAIISGGKPITGWKQVGNLWQTEIPAVKAGQWKFRELFFIGQRLTRARSPNAGYFRIEKAGEDRRTSFTFATGELKAWRGVEQLELVFLHDWSISRVKFAAIDETNRVAKLAQPVGFPAPHYAMDHFEPQPRYFVENSLELVDVPGEWHLEEASGALTYFPRPEDKLESFQPVAPFLKSLVQVQGDVKTGEPVRDLKFQGLSFQHCGWDLPPGGYAEGQATKHDPRDGVSKPGAMNMIPAAITFDLAERCEMLDCEISQLGGCGVWLRRECHDCNMTGLNVHDVAGNGLMLGEPSSRAKPTRRESSAVNGLCRNNRIQKNHVHDCGQSFFGAVGIWVGLAAETFITENQVYDLPYTGISLGWKWDPQPTGAGKNLVERNTIYNVLQTMSDGGGIYTLGNQPGTVLRDNTIYNVPLNAGRAESNGIFMDEGSSEMVVEENTIYNITRSPIRFHKALNLTIRNNKLGHEDKIPMFRFNACDPKTMVFENNVRIGDSAGKR